MRTFSLFALLGMALATTGCQMLREVNASTSAIRRNRMAIERSTEAIEKNSQALEKITGNIEKMEQG